MLRALLIYLSQAECAQRLIHNLVFAHRMALRFVAGEDLDSAIEAVKILNQKGLEATLDHLGEHVSSKSDARAATEEILKMLDRISAEDLRSGVSIKLTQLGLGLEEDVCAGNLRKIMSRAQERDLFVRIDMEGSDYTEATLGLFYRMLEEGYGDVVGIVIQSYLYRTENDVQRILEREGKVRLCKGAYKEPPEIAFPKKEGVDRNFDHIAAMLLDVSKETGIRVSPDGVHPPIPAIATHDEERIAFATGYAEKIDLPQGGVEFQMLYGIRSDLQEELAQEGYPVRIYVPYGTEWYPYFVRRLAERPANVWFFISNLIRG